MNEGTACTASYNCANYTESQSCSNNLASSKTGKVSCVGEGSQTANGSTTSEAQSAAKEKCECKVFTVSGTVNYSYFANDTGTTSDGCSYTKTYSGNPSYTFTTSASSGSVSGNQEGANLLCALASSNNKDKCSSSTTYSYTVDKKPTDSDCKTACGNNNATAIASARSMLQTRTGSTCSAAKSNATTAWKDFLSSHASNYCHCNPSGTVKFVLNTSHTYGVNAAIRLSNGAGTSINLGKNGSSSSFTTSPGSYSVGIQTQPGCANSTGVVSQCRSYSISPQNITVVRGQTVTVTMTVNC